MNNPHVGCRLNKTWLMEICDKLQCGRYHLQSYKINLMFACGFEFI